MSVLNETIVRSIVDKSSVPVVFRGYVNNWSPCLWSIEKWTEIFGLREYPFRCVEKNVQSNKPRWERCSIVRKMTFKEFVKAGLSSNEAMYFDYKYIHEWFPDEHELCKEICWDQFGFCGKGPKDTTLWIGSEGAHTSAHQDSYGVNIVVQVHGKKRWILFPPESGGLKPTRVPYEESSVYSELNFYCPSDTQIFKGLSGARVLELKAGDALMVPHKWWHYVQNEDPVNISLNMWLPHEEDESSRLSEAAIKIFVAQLCKDLSPEEAKQVINPTEDDLTDMSLSELLFQLKAASTQCLNKKHDRNLKRRRTSDEELSSTKTEHTEYDFSSLINNPSNKMEVPPIITGEELAEVIQETKNRYKSSTLSQDTKNDDFSSSFVKSVIDAFSQDNVLEQFKQNLLVSLNNE